MKKGVLTILLCSLTFLLFSGISAAETYGQGYQAPGYNSGWSDGTPGYQSSGYSSGWTGEMQGTAGCCQGNAYSSAPCNEACQNGNCKVISDQSYNSTGVPRKIQVMIPVTELVNDIQKIKQTIVTPICDQTTVIQKPFSTLASGTQQTIQSKECVDDGSGNCVPAIPGSPRSPIQVNGTTVWGQPTTQTSNQCHNEVSVTILPQTIQRNATAYKIVCFTWMDYVNTEIIKTTCTGAPQVSQVILPPTCTYCNSQNYGAACSSYQAPCDTCSYQKEYQYGSSFEGGFRPKTARVGKGPVLDYQSGGMY
jgi:hypothetical protein